MSGNKSKNIIQRRYAAVLLTLVFLTSWILLAQIGEIASAKSGPVDARLDKLSSSLRTQLEKKAPSEMVRVIVRLEPADLDDVKEKQVVGALKAHARESQERVLGLLNERDTRVLNTFWIANAILAEVRVSTVYELTLHPLVWKIHEDYEMKIIGGADNDNSANYSDFTWGLKRIKAPDVWEGLAKDGSGARVAVLDTGVDINHPDLENKMWTDNSADNTHPGGWIEFDENGQIVENSVPHDSDTHGTHCSGTVLGGDASGTAIGVAPGAWLMHAIVIPGGSGSAAQTWAGMQWAVEPHDQYGNPAGQRADAASMSFGSVGYDNGDIEPIKNMRAAGVVPVAAIGNSGEGTSVSPGNVYEAFGIGAMDAYDAVTWFSSGEVVNWPESRVVSIYSSDDVYVQGDTQGEYWQPQLKFDISDVIPGGTMESVKLWLYRTEGWEWETENMYVYRVDNQTWDETITTSEFDAQGLANQETRTIGWTSNGWDYVDVKNQFLSDYNAGNTYVTIRLKQVDDDSSASSYIYNTNELKLGTDPGQFYRVFHSRNHESYGPYLEIEYYPVYIKPDFSAPGEDIFSSYPGGDWRSWRGTSMATPHVAGVAALMRQANPTLTVDNIYEVLRSTADDLGAPGQDNRYGWGVVNAYDAVAAVWVNSGIKGYVKDADTSENLKGSRVAINQTGQVRHTDENGYYQIYATPDNYTLTASAFGYYDNDNTIVEVLENQWTVLDLTLTRKPTGFISGVVVDNVSNPIENASVTLLDTPLSTTTDADGNYVLENVPIGSYLAKAQAWGFKPAENDVMITENQIANIYSSDDVYVEGNTQGEYWQPQLKFDISDVPSGATIYSVKLWLYRTSGWGPGLSTYVYRVDNQTWDETITTNEFDAQALGNQETRTIGWTSNGWDYVDVENQFLPDYNASNTYVTIRLKRVDDDSSASNYIYNTNELKLGTDPAQVHRVFHSRNHEDYGPYLEIVYALDAVTLNFQLDSAIMLADAPWPKLQHDLKNTGSSPHYASQENIIKWTYNTGGSLALSPSIGPDGTIYITSGSKLLALYENGSLKWSYTAGGPTYETAPAISSDGTIYFGSQDGNLYALHENGSLKWSYTAGNNTCSPTIGPDGTIYFGSGTRLYALYENGSLKWSRHTGGKVGPNPAIGSDRIIYFESGYPLSVSRLCAFHENGSLKWSYPRYGDYYYRYPAIGPDGTIYFAELSENYNRPLYALHENGSPKWSFTVPFICGSPAIDPDGTIYFGGGSYADWRLFALHENGSLKWSYPVVGDSVWVTSPAIGLDGTIYFGAGCNFYALHENGSLKWSYTASANTRQPAIGSDGSVYFGSYSGVLYAIRPPDFAVSVDPDNGTLKPGKSVTATVTIESLYGYGETITLSADGVPDGVSVEFSPSSGVPPFSSTMSISTLESTPADNYELDIIGTGVEGEVKSTAYVLQVLPKYLMSVYSSDDVYVEGNTQGEYWQPQLKFDMSDVPSGAAIYSVKLWLYRTGGWGTGWNIYVYRVDNQTWDETITTSEFDAQALENQETRTIGWSSNGWDYVDVENQFLPDYNASNTYVTIRLKKVDDDSSASNYIYNTSELKLGTDPGQDHRIFHSRNHEDYGPYLEIEYA